jgi:hypothetical protein
MLRGDVFVSSGTVIWLQEINNMQHDIAVAKLNTCNCRLHSGLARNVLNKEVPI